MRLHTVTWWLLGTVSVQKLVNMTILLVLLTLLTLIHAHSHACVKHSGWQGSCLGNPLQHPSRSPSVDTAKWVYDALTNQAQVVQTYPLSTHTHTHTHTRARARACNTLYFTQGLLLVLAHNLPVLTNGDRLSGKDIVFGRDHGPTLPPHGRQTARSFPSRAESRTIQCTTVGIGMMPPPAYNATLNDESDVDDVDGFEG